MANKTSFDTTIDIGAKGVDEAVKKLKHLYKEANKVSQGWKQASKFSQVHIDEIDNLSTVMGKFTGKLSSEAKKSVEGLKNLSDQLKDAKSDAEALSQIAASAGKKGDTGIQAEAQSKLNEVIKSIGGLNSQIKKQLADQKAYGKEIYKTTEAQKNMREGFEKFHKVKPGEAAKDFFENLKSGRKGIGGAVSAAGRGIAGGISRKGLGQMEAGKGLSFLPNILGKITVAMGALTGAFAGISAVFKLISAASDHMTGLNKTLMDGQGFAQDFTSSAKDYMGAVDDIRGASINAAKSLLPLGVNSKQTLEIISEYSKNATGSLMKTRDQLANLGGGDLDVGAATFAKNATIYGKALGMEAKDVAATMGKFTSEMGYGAGQTQELMSNVVQAARTANMPMSKFMGIFSAVIPDVELYQNRLEELTGTIKMLSSTMDPKHVQKFMESFGKGFGDQDFDSRIRTMLIVGEEKMGSMLSADFESKIDSMADGLKEVGLGDDLRDAFKSNDLKKFQDVMIQARASNKVTAAQIGDMSQLFSSSQDLKSGDKTRMASAMKSGGMSVQLDSFVEEIKNLDKTGKAFSETGEITGIGEAIARKMPGMDDSKLKLMNEYLRNISMYQTSLSKYGTTGSKTSDAALRKLIAKDLKNPDGTSKDPSLVTLKEMAGASQTQIKKSMEDSNKDKESAQTMEDHAVASTNATLSIGDRIENYIGYLLEKIYDVVFKIFGSLDAIWNWTIGGQDQKATIKSINSMSSKLQSDYGGSPELVAQFQLSSEAITKAVSAGKTKEDLAKSFLRSNAVDINPDSAKNMGEAFASLVKQNGGAFGLTDSAKEANLATAQKQFEDAASSGNKDKMASMIYNLEGSIHQFTNDLSPEALSKNLMQFSQNLATKKDAAGNLTGISKAASESRKYERSAKLKDTHFTPDQMPSKEGEDRVSNLNERRKAMESGGESMAEKFEDAASGASDKIVAVAARAEGGRAAAASPASVAAAASPASPVSAAAAASPTVKAISDQSDVLGDSLTSVGKLIFGSLADKEAVSEDGANWVKTKLAKTEENAFADALNGNEFKNTLKSATLDSFRTALLEFAVIQAKMETNSSYKQSLATSGSSIQASGGTLSDFSKLSSAELEKWKSDNVLGSFQSGGDIDQTGLYNLHQGERVIPPGGSGGTTGGGGPMNVTININGTSLDESQLKRATLFAMDEYHRKHTH